MGRIQRFASNSNRLVAFLISIPIGILGGLIGLGGAEFRLPVLIGVLKRQALEAVPINLAISLITIITSLIMRAGVISSFPLMDLLPILLSMMSGGVLSALTAANLASKISKHALETWMKVLLIAIGLLLILEGFLHFDSADLINSHPFIQIIVGLLAGILIGIVSTSLGVAGGELIKPTLIFIFGVGIKVAGTASLIISLPTVCVGLMRYHHLGKSFDRTTASQIIVPMGAGSIIGSILGALLYGIFSPNILKVFLGAILIYAAIKMFMRSNTRALSGS